jgi:DNA-binding MarR family transcriptional regulator
MPVYRNDAERVLSSRITALLDSLSQGLHGELREQDLTPPLAMTLRLLDEPRSMRYLADAHHCDASNITGIVDRLEKRGLVERRADLADRRVTLIARTPDGDTMRSRLVSAALQTLSGLETLSADELEQLNMLLGRLIA